MEQTVDRSLPTFSIIIEWENARLSELGRTREMLRRLHKQLVEVGQPDSEIIILRDEEHVELRLIEEVIGEVADLEAWPARIRILSTDGLEYFEQKNFGARHSESDLVIFIDSDVVPEEGWLAGLISPFQNPDVQVVCGNTYMSTDGLYGKAFALFWFFPLRYKEDDLVRSDQYLWGNNVAFRRSIFSEFGYPQLPSFRGQSVALKETLKQNGINIYLQQRSRVSHPSPNGARHFVDRALCQGHDLVFNRLQGKSPGDSLATTGKYYLSSMGRSLARIARHHKDVDLGPAGAVGAFGIAACYYTVGLVGSLLTLARPELVRRHFSI